MHSDIRTNYGIEKTAQQLLIDELDLRNPQASYKSKPANAAPHAAHPLLVILLLSLQRGHRNTVQIPLSALRDPPATLLLILLQHTDLLEGLANLAVNAAAGIDVVGWAGATAVVVFSEV